MKLEVIHEGASSTIRTIHDDAKPTIIVSFSLLQDRTQKLILGSVPAFLGTLGTVQLSNLGVASGQAISYLRNGKGKVWMNVFIYF